MTKTATATAEPIATELRLTIVKHLAGGKDLDTTATLVNLDRRTVLDIASHHGYPSTELLERARGLLENKIERDNAPIEHPQAREIAAAEAARTRPAAGDSTPPAAGTSTASRIGRALTTGSAEPLTKPDEIRVLLNTAKGHESKRIQAQADRVFDAIDRLKALIREDQDKHAEKRRTAAEREAARAEVQRLEEQLRAAREKLRGPAKPAQAAPTDGGSDAAVIRAWARDNDVDCPPRGMLPRPVREAYAAAHEEAS